MIKYGKDAFGVTVELNLRYKKPVPLNEELKVVARVTSDRGRLFEGSGELVLFNGDVYEKRDKRYKYNDIRKINDK